MAKHNIAKALIIPVPETTECPEAVRMVYEQLPIEDAREKQTLVWRLEAHRNGLVHANVKHLIQVRDLLAPYPGFFEQWCEGFGMPFLSVLTAIRQEQRRLRNSGTIGGSVPPTANQQARDATRWIRSAVLSENFDQLTEETSVDMFLHFLRRHADTPENEVKYRQRCLWLAELFTKGAKNLQSIDEQFDIR